MTNVNFYTLEQKKCFELFVSFETFSKRIKILPQEGSGDNKYFIDFHTKYSPIVNLKYFYFSFIEMFDFSQQISLKEKNIHELFSRGQKCPY